MRKALIIEIISILFIILFVYAGTSKLLDYQKFKIQLGLSPMLTRFSGYIAWFIPFIEIIISLLLIINSFRIYGLYASFSLMTIFTAYIIAITRFSNFIPCSCGGILQSMSWNQHLVFNILFTIFGLIGILLESSKIKPELRSHTSISL